MATWEYEGIQCYVMTGSGPNHIPVYRAWDGSDHFLTTSAPEYNGLPSGYHKEGIAFYISRNQISRHVPFYRLYNSGANDHMYTTSQNERNGALSHGWRDEGVMGYAANSPLSDHVHLYRAYHPGIKDHFYTKNAQELHAVGTYVPEAEIPPDKYVEIGFDPTDHGFLFYNSFTISPSLLGVSLGEWSMGLCGGMSLATVRAFCSKQDLSSRTTAPSQGHSLFNELLQLQITTIPASVISKIFTWQCSRDLSHDWRAHSMGYRTKREWLEIQECLHAGRPVVLMLIRKEGASADITENHQVVAIGYRIYGNMRIIHIYDPNHPQETNHLVARWGQSRNRLDSHQLPRRSGQRMRGYFLNTDEVCRRKRGFHLLDQILNE